MPTHEGPLYNLAARVMDALGREWAAKRNDSWAALGHDAQVSSYDELDAKFGPLEVIVP